MPATVAMAVVSMTALLAVGQCHFPSEHDCAVYMSSVLLCSIVKWQSNSTRLTQDNIVTTTKYNVTALLSLEVVNCSKPCAVG